MYQQFDITLWTANQNKEKTETPVISRVYIVRTCNDMALFTYIQTNRSSFTVLDLPRSDVCVRELGLRLAIRTSSRNQSSVCLETGTVSFNEDCYLWMRTVSILQWGLCLRSRTESPIKDCVCLRMWSASPIEDCVCVRMWVACLKKDSICLRMWTTSLNTDWICLRMLTSVSEVRLSYNEESVSGKRFNLS